jgi:D-serine deaminase-like pyridoxal phosphate-dependent protein
LVAAVPGLRLIGVAGYEGSVADGIGVDDLAKVRSFLERIRDTARVLVEDLSLVSGQCVVTAGGSKYFDLVAEVFVELPAPAYQVVLRAGSYVSHDSGTYQKYSPLTRGGAAGLLPAIRVWGQVLSCPEQGRVLVGMGRRDVSFDAGFPVPELLWRAGAVKPVPAPQAAVVELNDQHAFLSVGNSGDWAQGDVIGFGISHPCTAFDKWRLIPVLDADHLIVDCMRTFF